MARPLRECLNTSPVIGAFYRLIKTKHIRTGMIASKAGLRQDTFRTWFIHERNPTVRSLEAALSAIGYRLEIVKDDD